MTRLPFVIAAALVALAAAPAEEPTPAATPAAPMGIATGRARPPVRDAQSRPITAGGFVDGAPVVFTDATRGSGLEGFQHRAGRLEKTSIIDTPGSGVSLLDYDGDGWLDVYLLNGSTVAALQGREPAPRAALFRNDGDGTFTDVTAKAGVANERWGFGVAAADFDNDGRTDLYVANFGPNRLYRNNGDGTFTDVAPQAGVTAGGWTAGPTWGDYDRDGWLDLFVAGYVKYDVDRPPESGEAGVAPTSCRFHGVPVFCGPRGLPGERDFLFRNNGDGTFSDVSAAAGVADRRGYYGFASAFVDVDDDGRLDLAVANDSVPNYLYRNRGDGTFEDVSYLSGFAFNGDGREQAGMGLAIGDYDRDGRVDLYVTNFSDDYNTLYRNEGGGAFSDVTFKVGLGLPTLPFLGWGTGFLDFDNDTRLDVAAVNGHVFRHVEKHDWGSTWSQRPLLFRNVDGARFEEVPPATGSGLAAVIPARGAAFGDLFNEGRVSAVVNNIDAPPTLLRNVVDNGNHWLVVRLRGGRGSPRDAIGARVFVTAGGVRQRGDVFSGGSYSSSSDPRLHFGLGAAAKVDSVEIRWPSGLVETVTVRGVDRVVTVVEGKGIDDRH